MQIDQEPRRHSHLYEVKPMNRWWFALAVAYVVVCLFATGWTNALIWASLVAGGLFVGAAIFVFPRTWLSKADDQR